MSSQQQALPERTPQWMEWGISVLNGMMGDYLQNRRNGLAIEMACYYRNCPLALTTESLLQAQPNPTAKLCILLHGLGCHEGVWTFPATAPGDPAISYGTLLQQELGYTPFYLRYNTGLPVAENGKALANLLDALLNCYPTTVDDLVLIGHSMGGLVLRSACHYGIRQGYQWVNQVKRVFYLGTPHEGAALEQVGHLAVTVLQTVPNPITQLIGKLLDRRSQGIKDLRLGKWLAEDGLDHALEIGQRENVPWLAHARHYLLMGTLTADPDHALALLLGDTLVRLPRAYGQAPLAAGGGPAPNPHVKVFSRVNHMRLAHDARVYEQIKLWCGSG